MMARSRRGFFLLLAIAAAVAAGAVWLAPAALLDAHVARMTAGRLRVDRTEGTVWRGRGVLVAATARIPFAWRIDAWPLLQGKVHLHVLPGADALPDPMRADIAIDGDHVVLRDTEITVPASLFAAASGTSNLWGAGGDVSLSSAALDWAPPGNHGAARISWRGARVIFPIGLARVELGDVAVNVTASDDRLTGAVSNNGGELAVRGDITFQANDGIRVALLLTPRRADNAPLSQVLSAIGSADGAGWRVDRRLPLR